jgi:hypothetical protein
MPQCQFPIFCCFFVSKKLHREYSQKWMKQKPNLLFFPKHHEVRRWDGGGPGARPTLGWRGLPLARATRGWGQLAHLLTLPVPPGQITFSRNILQAAIIVVARSGGSRSSSRHPAGEGNPCRRPSPAPWSPPEWCVSSLPWTTGP